jgi:hypothetical protein
MVFVKRGEIVTIGDYATQYCVDRVREEYRRGELVQVADLSDQDGRSRGGVLVEDLTKVGG